MSQGTFRVGAASTARLLLAPLGKRLARYHRRLTSAERLQNGLIIVLPGIDGCTTVSDNIARGLAQSGSASAVEVHDWRSFRGWNPLHLAMFHRNRHQAQRIRDRIIDYQQRYPNRPVHLIGHSAGAGMALFVLESLPAAHQVDSAVLLAAAVSRTLDTGELTEATRNGIWNFSSRRDLMTVGLGTMIFGTMDRRHAISAGALGFRSSCAADRAGSEDKLHEVAWSRQMLRFWHLGGHFGCTNSAFVSRYVAPIISGCVRSAGELTSLSH